MKIIIKAQGIKEPEIEFKRVGPEAEPVIEITVEGRTYKLDALEFRKLLYIV